MHDNQLCSKDFLFSETSTNLGISSDSSILIAKSHIVFLLQYSSLIMVMLE